MNHWHNGDREHMPNAFRKFMPWPWAAGDTAGAEMHVQPGAGAYEDRFNFYWLIVAWSVFSYHLFVMALLIFQMGVMGAQFYQWIPHLACTAIVDGNIAILAVIFRYVLFPAPRYYYSTPMVDQVYSHVPDQSPRTTSPFTTPQGNGVSQNAA